MYSAVYNKRHLVLRCYPATTGTVSKEQQGGNKTKHEDEAGSSSWSKQTATQTKFDAIKEIIAKLKEIYGGARIWALKCLGTFDLSWETWWSTKLPILHWSQKVPNV